MTERILKFPLFYHVNEEIHSEKFQNYLYYFKFSRSGFPHCEDKRAGISKIFLLFFTLFLYIHWSCLFELSIYTYLCKLMKWDDCGSAGWKCEFFFIYSDSNCPMDIHTYIGRYSLMITLDKLKLTVGVKHCWWILLFKYYNFISKMSL